MPEKERLLRLTMLCYRNPTMSEEEYHHHWTYDHTPLVRDWLAKYGVVRYSQV